MKKKVTDKIAKICDGILSIAGIYATAQPNSRPAGVSKDGANVFVSEPLANSSDTRAGAMLIHALAAFVSPFNVMSEREAQKIIVLVTASSSAKLISVLDKLHQERKGPAFGATLIKSIGAITSEKLAAIVAVKLYDHWGVISPAQKSLALAATGIQVHKTSEGGAVCDLTIVSGHGMTLKVKDVLNLLHEGKNPYPLVGNWEQIYRLVRVFTDEPSNEGMLDFAVSHQLLGRGVNDAVVNGVNKEAIARTGSKPAPQYGVGAIATPRGSQAPQGYTDVANMPEGNIIIPEANGATAVGAVDGSLVGTKAGASGISSDAAGTYARWKKEDAKTKDKGSEGGSALVFGLMNLKNQNPYLYSAMVAFIARFSTDKIDASNPSQYIASLVGISLARIVTGKAEDAADKEGVALAQSIHSNTPADFAKLQINMRAMYATFGVSSKADAYQLSNQAYSEGRINESDLVAMQQMYDVVYDQNSFGYLTKILQGKDKGLQIAKLDINFTNKMDENADTRLPSELTALTPDIRARNRAKFQSQKAQAPIDEGQEGVSQEASQEEVAPEEAMAAPAPEAPPQQGAAY